MAVAHVISAEQRAVETVASIDVPHSDVCLDTRAGIPYVKQPALDISQMTEYRR